MENSKIAWTDHTFSPWRGCTKVSEGCQFCYAERDSHRNPAVLGVWGPNGTREIAAETQWANPPKWNRKAETEGVRAKVFCASLSDVFEGPETMPVSVGFRFDREMEPAEFVASLYNDEVAAARARLFQLIGETRSLDWLLLTKRPQHVLPLYGNWLHWAQEKWPANAWIGISVENQARAEERLKYARRLREAGCPVVFVSAEPLLESVDLRPWLDRDYGVNWVICGGESGAVGKVRPFDPMWARLLRDQCGDAGVPFFMKQTGVLPVGLTVRGKGDGWDDLPEDLRVREIPKPTGPT